MENTDVGKRLERGFSRIPFPTTVFHVLGFAPRVLGETFVLLRVIAVRI